MWILERRVSEFKATLAVLLVDKSNRADHVIGENNGGLFSF